MAKPSLYDNIFPKLKKNSRAMIHFPETKEKLTGYDRYEQTEKRILKFFLNELPKFYPELRKFRGHRK